MTQLTFISSQKIFEESCPKGSVVDRLKNFIRLRTHKDPVINEVRKIINKMFSKTKTKQQIKLVGMIYNIRKL